MIIWTNVGIFLICSILWALVSNLVSSKHSTWIDILAGMTIMAMLISFGYPIWQ